MKILFFGDIYSKTGREMINKYLPILKNKYKADIVIANGENATHGKGLSLNHYEELINMGVDIITVGNHFFSGKKTSNYFSNTPRLIRPLNLVRNTSGEGSKVFEIRGKLIRVTVLLGRVYMKDFDQSSPFKAIDKIESSTVHIVEMHAEATAEKASIGHYLDGKVSAVLGTHTHVQSADETILSHGTGFISDVGMNGVKDSIIGATVASAIERDTINPYTKLEVAEGKGMINAVFLDIDDNTKLTTKIERIRIED